MDTTPDPDADVDADILKLEQDFALKFEKMGKYATHCCDWMANHQAAAQQAKKLQSRSKAAE